MITTSEKKYNILHIHTDHKFISDTERYRDEKLNNEIVFIGEEIESVTNTLNKLGFAYQILNTNDLQEIIALTKDFDIVIIYDLNDIKIQIVKGIDKNQTKIYLRLFGYELYGKVYNKFVSRKTLRAIKPITIEKYGWIGFFKMKLKRFIQYEYRFNKQEQEELYRLFDGILLFNEYEYEELNQYFYLPPFIKLNLFRPVIDPVDLTLKKNNIIIGNSRHAWNNHLDIIDPIKGVIQKSPYKGILFFNYGPYNLYTDKIKEITNEKFEFIEDFLDLDEFTEIYKTASALVINSHRQHALANIFTGILYGSKVYLSEKSSTYKWLKSRGFYICEVGDLKKDIIEQNIKLLPEQYEMNLKRFLELKQSNTKEDFIKNIINN